MTSVTRSIAIAAPPDAVWEALADYADISEWASNVDHSCLLTEQATGVGAIRRIQSGRHTLVEEIVGWEPPSVLSYTIGGVPAVRSVTSTWLIEAADAGTSVSLTTDVDGRRPLATAVARRLATAADSLLAGLKEFAE